MSKRILVVDDDAAVRKSFELALKKTPYSVDTANNGKEGVALFDQNAYDLVYLDLKMPVMSGAEALVKIRGINQSVPIYIVTAFHKEFFDQLSEARQNQLDFELLMKPIGLEQIRELTESLLGD